jgi:hypothetical protein
MYPGTNNQQSGANVTSQFGVQAVANVDTGVTYSQNNPTDEIMSFGMAFSQSART